MGKIKIIEGEIFTDYRGKIFSLNNFYFGGVKRCYFLYHPDTNIFRGWNAHKNERKWFYCIKGSFQLECVEIDNWENPSDELILETFIMTDNKSELVAVPKGYGTCLKANEPDSIMMVLSDKTLDETVGDNYKYESSKWHY